MTAHHITNGKVGRMDSWIRSAIVAFSFVLTARVAAAGETNKPIVVCFGDSITHTGYPAELEQILPVRAIDAGINGNTSRQGLARIDRDVISRKPSAVIVLFATNDMREDAPRVRVGLPEYETNLLAIIDRCRAAGAKVILGTIPPIDPAAYFKRHDKEKFDAAGGLARLISQYRETALRIAKTTGTPVVDLNKLLEKKQGWRKEDGVHPTAEGNMQLAKLFAPEVAKALRLQKQGKESEPVRQP